MKPQKKDAAVVALIWIGALGLGIPMLAWAGLLALTSLSSARSSVSSEARYEPMRSNDTKASLLSRDVGTCLSEYQGAHGHETYPPSLSELGPSGTGCLTKEVAEGRFPGHQVEYFPAARDVSGRIAAYMLCARPLELGKSGWETVVRRSQDPSAPPDPFGNQRSFRVEANRGLTEPIGCAATWHAGGGSGHLSIRQCLFEFAGKHPDRGYPTGLPQIGPEGSGCLSLLGATVAIERDVIALDRGSPNPHRYAYIPGLREGDGRIATFLIIELGVYYYTEWSNERGAFHRPPRPTESANDTLLERARQRSKRNPSSPETLERECKEGKADACDGWGDSLAPEWTLDMRPALNAYGIGCTGKHALSCYRIGEIYAKGMAPVSGPEGDMKPNPGACSYFETSCRLGLPEGCWDLVGHRETKLCAPTTSLSTRAALEIACRDDHAKACVALGRVLVMQGSRFTAKDAERSAGYFERACSPTEASGCASLSIAYAEGRGKPHDEARARYYQRLACALANDQASCLSLPPS